MINQKDSLSQLQGKWIDNSVEIDNVIEIIGTTIIEEGEEPRLLGWNDTEEKWVIMGGIQVARLLIEDNGRLKMYIPDNGPFKGDTFFYNRIG